jgi:hypothetical protein
LWRIYFDKDEGRFISAERTGSNKFGGLGKIEIAGDDDWIETMRSQLKNLVQARYGADMRQPADARFNLEPFEIIRDLLRVADASCTIGGAPQAVKIYQYLSSADVGIFWPNVRDGRLFLSGRPLLEYEKATINSILDPESLVSTWASGSSAEAAVSVIRAAETADGRQADLNPNPEELED